MEFKVGNKVKMINENPTNGFGGVKVGDIGVIKEHINNRYLVDFMNHKGWCGRCEDFELYNDNKSYFETTTTITGFEKDNTLIIKIKDNIKDVIYNAPATIVIWKDGTKTVVKCQEGTGDTYNPELGLAMCIIKKLSGNKGNYNDVFNKWLPKDDVYNHDYTEVNRPAKIGEWIKITKGEEYYDFPIGEIKQVTFRGDMEGRKHIRYDETLDDGSIDHSAGLMDGHYVVLEGYKK